MDNINMEDKMVFLLPGGYCDADGCVHREVELVSLTGREEELLARNSGREYASLVTGVLHCCIKRLGAFSPVPLQVVRDLLVADRMFLLLKLRENTFGSEVQATVTCPWPDCGRKVDFNFSIGDIPVTESVDKGPLFKMTLSGDAAFTHDDGEVYREIVFRLPTGADQEVAAPRLAVNEASALSLLLTRCITAVGPCKEPDGELIGRLSPRARLEIEKEMERVAPRVETELEGDCPECGREFDIPFDIHHFFFGELRTSIDLLYREVHYLAYHYNWSEKEIMDFPRQKRHKYIEILAEEIERLNNAVL